MHKSDKLDVKKAQVVLGRLKKCQPCEHIHVWRQMRTMGYSPPSEHASFRQKALFGDFWHL